MPSPTASSEDLWLFGYGSLIWRADFDFLERHPANLSGWERRFWQGSHDHRGTPEAPGRVVTLIPVAASQCLGMAYRIAADQQDDVLRHLDFREKNGYERFSGTVQFITPGEHGNSVPALVYLASPDNFAHLGEASDEDIARQIAASHGPSGSNVEYLMELHNALLQLGGHDEHVAKLVHLVTTMV